MRLFKKSFHVASLHFAQWRGDGRVRMLFILLAILIVRYLWPVTAYGLDYGTASTPFLLPVLFADAKVSNGLVKILLYLGIVCLYCEAPFIRGISRYASVRCGRKPWYLGGCLYLWLASAVYMLFLAAGCALVTLPAMTLSDLWGQTMRDFANYTDQAIGYIGGLVIPTEVIGIIYPSAAQILTFLAGWISFVFIGHVIYCLNLLTGRKIAGIAAAVLLIMLDPVVRYFGSGAKFQWLYRVSPVSWSSIENWTIVGLTHPLSAWYVFGMYFLLIMILALIIQAAGNKKELCA